MRSHCSAVLGKSCSSKILYLIYSFALDKDSMKKGLAVEILLSFLPSLQSDGNNAYVRSLSRRELFYSLKLIYFSQVEHTCK